MAQSPVVVPGSGHCLLQAPSCKRCSAGSRIVTKQTASGLAFGKTVTILPRDTDCYGRTVAEAILPDDRHRSCSRTAGRAAAFPEMSCFTRMMRRSSIVLELDPAPLASTNSLIIFNDLTGS